MSISISRFLPLILTLILPTIGFAKNTTTNTKPLDKIISIPQKLATLESSFNGKIGVYAINTSNNMIIQYRSNERFPMGCTSKVIGVAAILKQSMSNTSLLQHRVMYSNKDLLDWAPTTKEHVQDGMTITQLCEAAIVQSDNTAMNLLVNQLGGLKTINNFAHSIGNNSFRQDRDWPGEGLATPYDLRDSSTPHDMALSLQKLVLGDVLATHQHDELESWLKNSVTGYSRIRAGIPKGWIVGDKTGTGFYYGIANDIAVIWPEQGAKPIVIAIYTMRNQKNSLKREDIIASATRIIIDEFIQTDKALKLKSS